MKMSTIGMNKTSHFSVFCLASKIKAISLTLHNMYDRTTKTFRRLDNVDDRSTRPTAYCLK